MNLEKIDLKDTGKFSKLFLDYITKQDQLNKFYGLYPETNNFEEQIHKKKFSAENRKILCQELSEQYSDVEITQNVKQNITLLSDSKTFTITTGHQLNLFTGPLYFIYKIVSVINACSELKKKYPKYNFVPIYWMASEDHDFDEISYFNFNNKKYQWQTDQTGAVGHFETKSLKDLIESVPGVPDFFVEAYLKHKSLAAAVRHYVNELFGDHGLVVVDADSRALKSLMQDVMKQDILQNSIQPLVEQRSSEIESLGYSTQVHAREINFFYMADGIRNRLAKEGDHYGVLDTDILFSEEEVVALIEQEPEKLSPNVILRPVYQEIILPNLAYIGGPSEVGYWLQLKPAFDTFDVPFPMLMPRNFAMVLDEAMARKIEKTKLTINELFAQRDQLITSITKKHAEHDIYLNGQIDKLTQLFDKIKEQADKIDVTLAPHVEAQKALTKRRLEGIEKKFIRAEKRHLSDRINQLETILDKLFPNGGLQERKDNFLNFTWPIPRLLTNSLIILSHSIIGSTY